MANTTTDPTYIYDGQECPQPPRILRPRTTESPFTCDLRTTVIANLNDAIQAGWNGWEQACKMEDEGLQNYYMKYVLTLHDTMKKVRKF